MLPGSPQRSPCTAMRSKASAPQFWLPKCAKMALASLGGPLGRQLGSRSLPGRLPRRSRRPPGPKQKFIVIFRGASGEISQRDFTLPGGPGERFELYFRNSWGSFWPSVWRSVLKLQKARILQPVHTKTLIFRVPGASRAPFLEAKTLTKTTWKPRACRSPLRESKNPF